MIMTAYIIKLSNEATRPKNSLLLNLKHNGADNDPNSELSSFMFYVLEFACVLDFGENFI